MVKKKKVKVNVENKGKNGLKGKQQKSVSKGLSFKYCQKGFWVKILKNERFLPTTTTTTTTR